MPTRGVTLLGSPKSCWMSIRGHDSLSSSPQPLTILNCLPGQPAIAAGDDFVQSQDVGARWMAANETPTVPSDVHLRVVPRTCETRPSVNVL